MLNRSFIINIGSELSTGFVINDNGSYLASRLDMIGAPALAIKSIPDDPIEIAEALKEATSKAKWVVISGGLGPTADDLTREAVAAALGLPLEYHKDIVDYLHQRLGKPTEGQLRMAYVPRGAAYVMPESGAAPGIRIEHQDSVIFLLPGVPQEMREMAEGAVIPEIYNELGEPHLFKVTYSFCELPEVRIEEQLKDIIPKLEGYSLLPGGLETILRISVEKKIFEEIDAEIKETFKGSLFGMQGETLEESVAWVMTHTGKTLAAAESCTGGLIGDRITNVPGSSKYFLGSITAYSNELKTDILGVDPQIVENHGAVSQECAEAMARQAANITGSDVAVSTTGIAGPEGGNGIKPVGLVWVSVYKDETLVTKKYVFNSDRAGVKLRATQAALNMVRLTMLGELEI